MKLSVSIPKTKARTHTQLMAAIIFWKPLWSNWSRNFRPKFSFESVENFT